MKLSSFLKLSMFGITTVLGRRKKPIIGSIILTDRCNLSCSHCAVSNITGVVYPYTRIKSEMHSLYKDGVRILFFYGGEPFLWRDRGKTLRDLVKEAKQMGFIIASVVTNGTFPLDLPEADLLLISLDGGRKSHDKIRGVTYDQIIKNIENAATNNICLYMALNKVNKRDIEAVCAVAKRLQNVQAISFNFHLPYPGTEHLKLSKAEKKDCCDQIADLIKAGYPILNLKSAFPYIINNTFKTPCYQCVVVENGRKWICGRCIEIEGLCEECGFFFSAEFSLVFRGKVGVIVDMLNTYLKHI